jgi:LL-diaminopimelate aminotransferase
MKVARRVENLPPYLFAELDRRIAERRAAGQNIISLGVGDPDTPTPEHIVDAVLEAARDPSTHQYPSYYGLAELRSAIADWHRARFGVELDPETEVLPLIGSKEGLAHLSVAFVDPGDEALVPDPGYPVYGIGTTLAGGTPVPLPLRAENGFLPDLDEARVTERTKILWLNYPSNPTAAVTDLEFFSKAVAFAGRHDLLLAHDAAYSEITYDGYVAPSVLEVPGAKDVAVEFNSLSKGFNMTGWRIGWCAGSAEAIRMLGTVKTNLDSGIWNAVQSAGIAALRGPQDHLDQLRAQYQKRRDLVVGRLNRLGWDLEPPLGSIYVWLPTPEGQSSADFAELLLDRAGVVVAPGRGYGEEGEGFVRISLTVPDDLLAEAMDRVAEAVAS